VRVEGVVDEGPTLVELARAANREHQSVTAAGQTMVQHAIAAGEALLAARNACEEKQWLNWCADNIKFSYGSVALYMRVARYRDVLEGLDGPPVTTLARAKDLLVGVDHGDEHWWNSHKYPPEIRAAAKRLRDDGMSYAAISRTLGVHYGTIKEWFNPDLMKRRRAKTNKRRAERVKARHEHREREIKTAARKAGGAVAEAYSLAERMQDVIGKAQTESTDTEAREALARAGTHYRKMRDEIVVALGVSHAGPGRRQL
jgi:transposase